MIWDGEISVFVSTVKNIFLLQVPIMLDRLHALQREMHEEYVTKEASKEDENKRHFPMFGTHSASNITSPSKGVVFKSPSKCDKSPSVSTTKTGSKSGQVKSENLECVNDSSETKKVNCGPVVTNMKDTGADIPGASVASKTKCSDTTELNSINKDTNISDNSESNKTDDKVKNTNDEVSMNAQLNSVDIADNKSVTASHSQTPCSSKDKQSACEIINGAVDNMENAIDADIDSEDEVKKEDITVEDRKARLKRTLSPSFYSDDVYRLKKQRTHNDSFISKFLIFFVVLILHEKFYIS